MEWIVERNWTYVLLIAILLITLAGCGATPSPVPPPTATQPPPTQTPSPTTEPTAPPKPAGEFVGYDAAGGGFGIEFPADWQVVEREASNTILFVSPAPADSTAFRENVGVTIQDLGTDFLTLEDYTGGFLSQAPDLVGNYHLIDSQGATLADQPAYRVVYTGEQMGLPLQWLQVWTLKDGRAYIVTYTAEPDQFDEFLDTAAYMISSFELP
jgi:serine/threonine-protein kinase